MVNPSRPVESELVVSVVLVEPSAVESTGASRFPDPIPYPPSKLGPAASTTLLVVGEPPHAARRTARATAAAALRIIVFIAGIL